MSKFMYLLFFFALVSCVVTACANNKKTEDMTSPSSSPSIISDWTAGIVHDSTRIQPGTFAIVQEVRTAHHDEYDRIVFEFSGSDIPGFHIEYIDQPVRECGSGKQVYLPGDGWLMIKFLSARMHEDGKSTVTQRDLEPNHPTLLRLTTVCDFENYVTWVASVATPNKFQVLTLQNPSRLIVDIKN